MPEREPSATPRLFGQCGNCRRYGEGEAFAGVGLRCRDCLSPVRRRQLAAEGARRA